MQIKKDIENLNNLVLKMADTVTNNIRLAFECYLNKTVNIVINDKIVNNYEKLIDEICLEILIRDNPYASDLRMISGILKLVADIERIGDHAEDILKFNKELVKLDYSVPDKVQTMLKSAMKMVENSIISYVSKDILLANEVIKQDDFIDKMYEEEIRALINTKNINTAFAIYTVLVIKYIERIADHAVNIAEWVIFIFKGV